MDDAKERFSEEEAAAIFARAAEAEVSGRYPVSGSAGLTLAELQEIGREAGIAPEAVARAAASLRQSGAAAPAPTFLRIPIGVARSVTLARPLSEEEWVDLVAELRATFDAPGRVQSDGTFREWRNGNLRIYAGPAPEGYRVDMRTTKSSAWNLMAAGTAMTALSGTAIALGTITGAITGGLADFLPILGTGAGIFGVGALQLPGWVRRRREQFERIAERLKHVIRP